MHRRTLLKTLPLLATPALAQGTRPLRFIPQANLSVLDPVWTTAIIAYIHSYMIYDTLYGIDDKNQLQPQMCAGHELSADELTWTFKLRDGLRFHDGEKVLARDCTLSIQRWAIRDAFGQQMARAMDEIVALDDMSFRIRLKKPFRPMLYGLGARQCFMMPERVAKTPASEQLKDTTGSGPFRFLAKEWVSGVSAAYAKFDGYVPRHEKPVYYAGGKVAHFGRVEWTVQPDPATAAAALQKGEVDWLEQPLVDLCPMLRKSPGVEVKVIDPNGYMYFLALNHLQPPFDNPKIRRALLHALDQKAFIDSVVGDQTELGHTPTGYFTPSMPMANGAGTDIYTGKRDPELARKLIIEAGYKGERTILLSPSDNPAQSQLTQIARQMFESVGLNVDYQVMDWGSLVSRRTNQGPPDKGGRAAFISIASSFTASGPGSYQPIRGNGTKGWFGWPTDPELETLRENWFDAPTLDAQKAIAAQVQARALETLPILPLGQFFQPAAFRSDIKDIVTSSFPVFWGVRRA